MLIHFVIFLGLLLQPAPPSLKKSVTIDLGSIAYGSESQFKASIENDTDKTWTISNSVQKCKCFRLDLPQIIMPNGSVTAVGFFRPSKIGKFEQKHAFEGDFGALEIIIKGECLPLFTIDKSVIHSNEEPSEISLKVHFSDLLKPSNVYSIQVRGTVLRDSLNLEINGKSELPFLVQIDPRKLSNEYSTCRIEVALVEGNKNVVATETVTVLLDDRTVTSPRMLTLDGSKSEVRVFVSASKAYPALEVGANIRSEIDSEFKFPIKVVYVRKLANTTVLIGLELDPGDYRRMVGKRSLSLELYSDEFSSRVPIEISGS